MLLVLSTKNIHAVVLKRKCKASAQSKWLLFLEVPVFFLVEWNVVYRTMVIW